MKLSDLKQTACWKNNPHLEDQPVKKSKYRNEIVEFDGIKFRSIKERNRYVELRMLHTAGKIADLRLQVPYELNPGGTHSLKYYADFVYLRDGLEVVEDAKGYRTKLYRKKFKLMEQVYNIKIHEV